MAFAATATTTKASASASTSTTSSNKGKRRCKKRLICASATPGLGAAEEMEVFLKQARATGSGRKTKHPTRHNSRALIVGPTVNMHPGLNAFK